MFHSWSAQHLCVDGLKNNLSWLEKGNRGKCDVLRHLAENAAWATGDLLELLFVLSAILPALVPRGPGGNRPGRKVSDCQHMVSWQAGCEHVPPMACPVPARQRTPALTFKLHVDMEEEEEEAPLLFEELDAMALHYQAIMKAWHSEAPSKKAQNHLIVGLNNATELHAWLTGAVQLPVPPSFAGVYSAEAWKRFHQRCNVKNLTFNALNWQKHKDNLFNWPYRRDAFKALHGDALKPAHVTTMDIVSGIFMDTDKDEAWIFAGAAHTLTRFERLEQDLQQAYWSKSVNRVRKVEDLLSQTLLDSWGSDDAWCRKLQSVLRALDHNRSRA